MTVLLFLEPKVGGGWWGVLAMGCQLHCYFKHQCLSGTSQSIIVIKGIFIQEKMTNISSNCSQNDTKNGTLRHHFASGIPHLKTKTTKKDLLWYKEIKGVHFS